MTDVALLFLPLLLACAADPAPESPTAPIEVDASVHASQIRADLTAAQNLWTAEQRAEAQQVAQRSWSEHFAPIDDRLRAHDPDGTLEIEYAFSRLSGHLGRRGEAGAIASEIRKLSNTIDTAVAALPPPLPQPGDAPQGSGAASPGSPAAPLSSGPRPVSMPAPPLPGGTASPSKP